MRTGQGRVATRFLKQIRGIRPKTLRNLLKLYFYTYVIEELDAENARVHPGLKAVMRFLKCSRATAQDYLRAIQVMRELFKIEYMRRLYALRKRSLHHPGSRR